MKNWMKKYGVFNILVIALLLVTWIITLTVHNLLGVYTWVFIKMIFPLIGLLLVIISLVIVIVKMKSKRFQKYTKIIGTLSLGVFMCLHVLLLIGVVPMSYPANLKNSSPSLSIESLFDESCSHTRYFSYELERLFFYLLMRTNVRKGVVNELIICYN